MTFEIVIVEVEHETKGMIEKAQLIVKDDNGLEITKDNWTSDHPLFDIRDLNKPSTEDRQRINNYFNITNA